jgi:hypothetical protein
MFAEFNYFYRKICAKQISKTMMQKLEKEILVLVCNMEKVFPPRWFNMMQHLLVHLPWEAKVGGPVQFRWMYSQETFLKKLRFTVWNKARVEGCIVEAFTCKEITNFSTIYFSHANNVNAHIACNPLCGWGRGDLQLEGHWCHRDHKVMDSGRLETGLHPHNRA